MSLYNIFNIAGSGMTAQSARMNVAASNLANADSAAGPDGEPYRARQVVFEVAPDLGGKVADEHVGGVRAADVVASQAPFKMEYKPASPLADDQGFVRMPNVDPTEEMVNMISASRSYQANVEVINTSKELMLRTLTIGK